MLMIDEFKFPHCIYQLGKNELNMDGCKYGYDKMMQFLKLNKSRQGLTLIIAQEWMFMTPIFGPYHYEKHLPLPGHDFENGIPVYLDGFAYTGLINI